MSLLVIHVYNLNDGLMNLTLIFHIVVCYSVIEVAIFYFILFLCGEF